MLLTLKYRPKKFTDVVGQKHIVPVLSAFVRVGPPPVLIFSGEHGLGKTTLARITAAALNCEKEEADACGECSSCLSIREGGSDAVLETDAATHGGVADVAKIRETCSYTHSARWRVVIIDEAQALSRDAFHALLRIFEEPPEHTVFMLMTTEPQKILKTIHSRAVSFEFKPVLPVDIARRLQHVVNEENYDVEPIVLARIAKNSNGHVRDAIMELDKCVKSGITDDSSYVESLADINVSLDILACAIYGDFKKAFECVDAYFLKTSHLRKFLDDIVDGLNSISAAVVGVPSSSAIADMARIVPQESLGEAYSLCWAAYDKFNFSSNAKTSAKMFVKMLVDVLAVYESESADIVEISEEKSIISREEPYTLEEALASLE